MTKPLRNVLFVLQFDGSKYHGFQVQKGYVSICEAFQDAVEQVLGYRWAVKGCSRTDKGVHAICYGISMQFRGAMPTERFARALNQHLPSDIAVVSAQEVPVSFHARYDCTSKEYTYRVHNSFVKDVFRPKQVYLFRYVTPIDTEQLHHEAQAFVGQRDFSAVCADLSEVESPIRTIYSFSVHREGDEVVFRVRGDGFLYNMVRIMVGTLLHVSSGRIPTGSIPAILESRDRLQAGFTAPAHGLYLTAISYKEEHTHNE